MDGSVRRATMYTGGTLFQVHVKSRFVRLVVFQTLPPALTCHTRANIIIDNLDVLDTLLDN